MFNVGFFPDTIKARSFNLCMVITLLGVYIVILGLMILTLFQDHSCTRNINCKLEVLDFFYSLNVGLLHTLNFFFSFLHFVMCVTLVCIQGGNEDVFRRSSVWACLNLSHWDLLRNHTCDKC